MPPLGRTQLAEVRTGTSARGPTPYDQGVQEPARRPGYLVHCLGKRLLVGAGRHAIPAYLPDELESRLADLLVAGGDGSLSQPLDASAHGRMLTPQERRASSGGRRILAPVSITEARADLVRGLLQSCYVIEHARSRLQQSWGGDFDRDAERTLARADRLGRLLDSLGFRRPDEVIDPHVLWWSGLCGDDCNEVPLGAAVLHQFGKWSDVFAEPYLGTDSDEFVALGREHSRVDIEVRTMNEEEAFLPQIDLPPGRRFVVLTDVHIGSHGREEIARKAVADINSIDPEFVVIPGDFTEDGEPEQFRIAKEIFDELRCPYYAVLGNHDAVQRSTREPMGTTFFRQTFGVEPTDHVLECGDLQVALVDTTDPTASPFPDWDVARGSIGGEAAGVDSGALRPGQIEELAGKLDTSRPVLVVQHHELHPFPGFPPVKFALREEDAQTELDVLSGHNLIGVVAGHTHRSAVLEVGTDPVMQVEIPSLKDWPYAYTVVGVTDDAARVAVRQVSDRDTVWSRAKDLWPLMRRFAISPVANLDATLRF